MVSILFILSYNTINSFENDHLNFKMDQSNQELIWNKFTIAPLDSVYNVNDRTSNWIDNEKDLHMFNLSIPCYSDAIYDSEEKIYSELIFKEKNNFELFKFKNNFEEIFNNDEESWYRRSNSMLE